MDLVSENPNKNIGHEKREQFFGDFCQIVLDKVIFF